jgi:NADH-quinone oxidoreductase subunit M
MVQPNMKKLVAYSSVSHLGFVVLGIFSFTQLGLDGAVYQMLNHGISTGALFAIVGLLYERRHSLEIEDYGGVASVAPWLSTAFLVTTLASIGLPLLNNFVGEFLVLQGAAIAHFQWAIYAGLGVILSACYMLWLYQRVFYGETSPEVRAHVPDLNFREWAAVVPLIVMMVWMGVYSQSFLAPVGRTTARVLAQSEINVPFDARNARPASGAGFQPAFFPATVSHVGQTLSPVDTAAASKVGQTIAFSGLSRPVLPREASHAR